jgi:hypothetical protein
MVAANAGPAGIAQKAAISTMPRMYRLVRRPLKIFMSAVLQNEDCGVRRCASRPTLKI